MAGNGGKRPGAGRPKGSKNKKTLELEELTRKHAPEAVQRLVDLMNDPTHPGHVTAIKELLDRGYGKPKQAQEHSGSVEVRHTSAAEEVLRRLEAIAERKGS